MTARDELRREMTHNHLYMTDERADELINAYAHQLAEQIRAAAFAEDGPAMKWDWWDAATIPASCADLIDPEAQHAA